MRRYERPSIFAATSDASNALSVCPIFASFEIFNDHSSFVITETRTTVPLQESRDALSFFQMRRHVRSAISLYRESGETMKILGTSGFVDRRVIEGHADATVALKTTLGKIFKLLDVARDTRATTSKVRGMREYVHSIKVTNAHASVSLQWSCQYVHSVELAYAHAAFPLQRSGENVGSVEVTYARTSFALKRSRGFGILVEWLQSTVVRQALAS